MRNDTMDDGASPSGAAAPSAVVVSPTTAPPPPLTPPSPLVVLAAELQSAFSTSNRQETRANAYQRKRTERMFSCESMKNLDRDLRITGVTKKGASWQYHIEVLDTRVRMPSFTDPGSLSSSMLSPTRGATATAAASSSSPVAEDDATNASYAELPPMVRYSVMRRYNDFRQLYMYLADTYSAELLETLPKFPEGGILSYIRGDDPRLLKYRKEQLQKFLRALDEHPYLKWCKGFTHFLRPDLLELTTIGGMFQTQAESSASAPTGFIGGDSGDGIVSQPPTSSSGYVSLSMVKSPEIRFGNKKLGATDGRGDWKRRRVPSFPSWSSNNERDTGGKPKKRVSLTEEEDDDEEEEGEDADDDDQDDREADFDGRRRHGRDRQEASGDTGEQQQKTTQMMKLLSLEAPATQ